MSEETKTGSVYRTLPVVGAVYKTPDGAAEPAEGTIRWWGVQRRWPAWLVEAMAIQRHANEVLDADALHALAEQTAGLPLGAQKGRS